MLSLITGLHSVGNHPAGWRHPDAWTDTVMNLEHMIETAQTAERGKFDSLFISDGNGVQQMQWTELFEANCLTSKPAVFEQCTPGGVQVHDVPADRVVLEQKTMHAIAIGHWQDSAGVKRG